MHSTKHVSRKARCIAAALCACLAVSWVVPQGIGAVAAEDDARGAAVYSKSEVVYASLAANGALTSAYTVNGFSVEQSGTITDYGSYDSVKALNEDFALAQKDDEVTFDAPEGVFYYQGTSNDIELPWTVEVSYELDGKDMTAEQIAGASGKVRIHLTTTRNADVDETYAECFMQQITFTLASEKCTNIVAEGAAVAEAGANKTVAFTVLPGKDADCTVSFDATDFTMDGIQIAAVPYSMAIEMPDTDDMVSQFDQLSSAIGQFADGSAALADGLGAAAGGTSGLAQGSEQFGDGLADLSNSSDELLSASGMIDQTLKAIDSQLQDADFSQLEQLGQLPSELRKVADSLDKLSIACGQVSSAAGTLEDAWTEVGEKLEAARASGPSDEEIESLKAALDAGDCTLTIDQKQTVNELIKEHDALAACVETYEAQEEEVTSAVGLIENFELSGVDAVTSVLRALANGIEGNTSDLSQLTQLAEGIHELSTQYSSFDEGFGSYASGIELLSSSYSGISNGATQLDGAFGQLKDAADLMAEGMETLDASTSVLPQEVREQVSEMLADYEFPEFDGRSFASSENGDIESVQFVLTTATIKVAEPEAQEEPETTESLWDRIVGLFS